METKFKVEVEVDLLKFNILFTDYFLVCDYWLDMEKGTDKELEKYEEDGSFWHEHIVDRLIDGHPIKVFEIEESEPFESDGGKISVLNLNMLKKGISLFYKSEDKNGNKLPSRHLTNWLDDSWDAETQDVFIQLCILGELVYG